MLRRWLTLILVVLLAVIWVVSNQEDEVREAELAPQQVANDNTSSETTSEMVNGDTEIRLVGTFIIGGILLMLWLPLPRREKRKNDFFNSAIVALLLLPILAACGPAEKEVIINIEPNQTAFVVPLIGDTTEQLQLQSVEFLQENQVAAKQIVVPQRKRDTGRAPWSYEWIPSVAVIIVDRTPVTREWTSSAETGSSPANQAFGVESSESIDFKVGATCSALVEEAQAAEFLYYFSGKGLSTVMDENVRGFIQAELFREFGQRTLKEAQQEKSEIFATMLANVQAYFSELGVTITSCGGSEGLIYSDPQIQAEINQNFAVQQEAARAEARGTAQAIENEQLIAQANTYATATVVAGMAQASILESSQQQIEENLNFAAEQEAARAQARATAQSIDNRRLIEEASAYATATTVAGMAQASVLSGVGDELSQNPGLIQYEMAQNSTGEVPSILIISDGQVSELPFSFFLSPDEWSNYGVDVTPVPNN